MPETLAGQESTLSAPAPAEAPADGGLDIEKIRQEAVAAAMAATEDRVKGFQRLLAERDRALTDLTRQLDEARLASLPDDDRQAEIARREASELERLKAENELLKLMPDYGDVFSDFQRLLGAQDARAQLEFLRELKKATTAPATGAPADPEVIPAAVDPNNPASGRSSIASGDPNAMNESLADQVLRSVSRMR